MSHTYVLEYVTRSFKFDRLIVCRCCYICKYKYIICLEPRRTITFDLATTCKSWSLTITASYALLVAALAQLLSTPNHSNSTQRRRITLKLKSNTNREVRAHLLYGFVFCVNAYRRCLCAFSSASSCSYYYFLLEISKRTPQSLSSPPPPSSSLLFLQRQAAKLPNLCTLKHTLHTHAHSIVKQSNKLRKIRRRIMRERE